MKRWISLILTAALCTSMCCIYAPDLDYFEIAASPIA